MASILDDFSKLFKQLPKHLKEKIKIFSVFNHGAICATSDGQVYLIGEQLCKQMGYEDHDHDYSLVIELSGKNVDEFFTSGYESGKIVDWVIVRSTDNKVFSFGRNDLGQLGRSQVSSNIESLKAEEIQFLSDKNIVDISCGQNHCLTLSSDCRVFGWGDNSEGQVGCGDNGAIIETPIQLVINESVKHIHCDSLSSFAITITDQVYCWGRFQLKNNTISTMTPLLLNLENVSKVYQDHFGQNLIILQNDKKVYHFDGRDKTPVQSIESIEFTDMTQVSFNKQIALLPTEVGRGVHELSESGIKAMNYFNFNDYFVYKQNVTNGTLHLTNDLSIKSKHIEIIENSNGNELNVVYNNIFDQKYSEKFDEIRTIGEGTFGHVFKVKDKQTGVKFAIKRLEPKSEKDSCKKDLQEVMNEIRIMIELKGDYTVKYINAWIEGKVIDRNLVNYVYIQMEYCPKNLLDIIGLLNESFKNYESFKYFIRSELLVEIIECLKNLHSFQTKENILKHIIHRDLKPANILITFGQNGRFVKLCDFGLAKFFEGSMSNSGGAGTPNYMAPEVLNGSRYTYKADFYSLAVVTTNMFEINKNIKQLHKDEQGVLQKYLDVYSNETLKEKFTKLFVEVIKMSQKESKDRPDSQQLLTMANQWRISKDLVTNDDKFNDLVSILNEPDSKILKLILESKLR